MSSLLWRPRVRPARVATDTVVPVHFFDDSLFIRPIVMYFMMRFDDVLDAEALGKSLKKLLSLDGWRKLGARMRINDQGKLEYHIPSKFDDERQAIDYHHEALATSIKEHEVASKLPTAKAGDTPQVMGKAEDFISLMRQEGDPKTVEDYLYSDRPLLGLRVVCFNDATLVTLSWSHVVLDGMGRKNLLDAWSLVLHGREGEVPKFHGFATDPLAPLGINPHEEYKHADKKMNALQLLVLAVRNICFKLWSPLSADESRVVMLPASYAQHLCNTARAELSHLDENQIRHNDSPTLFISEGDVVCAWWTRLIVAAQLSATSTRTVAINVVFGLRWLLGQDLIPSDSSYVANALVLVPAFIPARDLLAKPLGHVAALIRAALQTLGTRDQVEACAALSRSAISRGGALLFGDAWMQMVVCSNWSKGKFFETDFSGAVLKDSTSLKGHTGQPSYIQAYSFAGGLSMINAFSILGKDAKGNIWLQGILRKQYWPAVEEALATFV